MKEKIVLIDGHSILNRAFYGLPDLTNSEGRHTNAVYGFLNIMFKILEEENPQYLTVAFDLSTPTFRHKMFPEYKGTRKAAAPEFREQVPLMKEVLKAMGVTCVELEGYEADDLLGTIAKKSEEKGLEVSLVSGDRDLLQLASEQIKIRIPKTKGGKTTVEDYYAKDVQALYQVTPTEFIDVKALMGDTSDNIPGIPGVGEKTATKIIAEYKSIENAMNHVDEIKPNKARESLREHYDKAVMSKELAAINVNSPIDYSWEDSRLQNLYTEEAYALFQQLEFKNLLGRFQCEAAGNPIEERFCTVTEETEADMIFAKAGKAGHVGAQLVVEKGQVKALALAFDENVCCIMAQEEEPYQMELFPTEDTEKKDGLCADRLCRELEAIAAQAESISMLDGKSALAYIKIEPKEHLFDV